MEPGTARAAHSRPDTYELADPYRRLRPLLRAEAAAEAPPGGGIEAADLEQAVWLRLLELDRLPAQPGDWVGRAVRQEAREAAGRIDVEQPCGAPDAGRYGEPGGPAGPGQLGQLSRRGGSVEDQVLAAEHRRAVFAALRLLPGRCPRLVAALLSAADPTYPEISTELGISQGSLGPLRSRCLSRLRTILDSRVGSPVGRGNAR
jgi:DNA-directed RNA polymerase specialized sigma24 family protein